MSENIKGKLLFCNISDNESTNFKEIKAGNIACGILYRCSNPLKGGVTKKVKGALAVNAGIKCIINLDDDNSVIEKLSKAVPWYQKLARKEVLYAWQWVSPFPALLLMKKN